MCTFSWWPTAEGYGFLFNRDELHTRAAESPPAHEVIGGVACLAPRDGDAGGTWLGVNQHGLGIVVLNDYNVSWRPESPALSRGQLVRAALGAGSLEAVGAVVGGCEVGRTGAFRLIAISRAAAAHVYHWNGECLDHFSGDDVDQFFSSSSFRPAEIVACRRARYDQLPVKSDENALRALYWSHDPAAGAHSILMRRDDAATRSVCEVAVGRGEATFSYTPVVWDGEVLAPSRTVVSVLPLS